MCHILVEHDVNAMLFSFDFTVVQKEVRAKLVFHCKGVRVDLGTITDKKGHTHRDMSHNIDLAILFV